MFKQTISKFGISKFGIPNLEFGRNSGKFEIHVYQKFRTMLFRMFVPGTYVGDLNLVLNTEEFQECLKLNNFRTVYIVKHFDIYSKYIANVNVYPFGGGFMDRSLILFPLNTQDEITYFEQTTETKYA